MGRLENIRDTVLDKSMDILTGARYADHNQAELRNLYADATVYRTQDSFRREKDVLHVDITDESPISSFADEIESPSPYERLKGIESQEEWKAEGLAEGLYQIFDENEAENLIIYSDEERYFGPSSGGIASMEVIRKMEEERNIHWRTDADGEDYLWQEIFDESEHELWSNWLDQRPRPPKPNAID